MAVNHVVRGSSPLAGAKIGPGEIRGLFVSMANFGVWCGRSRSRRAPTNRRKSAMRDSEPAGYAAELCEAK